MREILFIAGQDIRYQFRQGATIIWALLMPPIFFFFIGTVTSGFSDSTGGRATALILAAENPGFLGSQLERRLRDYGFAPRWASADAQDGSALLILDDELSTRVVAGETVAASYSTPASALTRDYELLRLRRSLYSLLADLAAAPAPTADGIESVNVTPRLWTLAASSAGARRDIPSGFEQAIPGMLVMFTLLVLLTSSASLLAVERGGGLLRRLASAPINRGELVAGKWLARMALGAVQVTAALVAGTLLFDMAWGPDLGMVLVVLGAWAAFCASAGMLLGSVASSEAQATGLGILIANVLAALGGCWWPIEVTPAWMQFIQKITPTGWAMDAMHKLISFEAGSVSALPNTLALAGGALALGWFAARQFRYE